MNNTSRNNVITQNDSERNESRQSNNSSKPQQYDDSTLIRRTLVERGTRPASDDNRTGGHGSTATAITTITKQHQDDQRELQELNTKFAVYLDRVHYLENHNHRLTADLSALKQSWGGDAAQLQAAYDPKLHALREQIDNAIRDQAVQELQLKRHEYELWQIQQQIATFDEYTDLNRLNQLKQELDGTTVELEHLRNQFDQCLTGLTRQRSGMEELLKELDGLKNELDNQQLERIVTENELQTLREHAAFQDAIYQAERNEYLLLSTPVLDVSGFYRGELARAISDIRQDFEVLSQSQVNELEEYYRVKTEDIRSQIEAENERKRLLANEGAIDSTDKTHLTSSLRDNQNSFLSLQAENNQLQAQLDAIAEDLEKIQNNNERDRQAYDHEVGQLRQLTVDKQDTIDNILENNISLRFELSTYGRLLQVEEQHLNRMEQYPQQQQQPQKISLTSTSPLAFISQLASAVPLPSFHNQQAPDRAVSGLASAVPLASYHNQQVPDRAVSGLTSAVPSASYHNQQAPDRAVSGLVSAVPLASYHNQQTPDRGVSELASAVPSASYHNQQAPDRAVSGLASAVPLASYQSQQTPDRGVSELASAVPLASYHNQQAPDRAVSGLASAVPLASYHNQQTPDRGVSELASAVPLASYHNQQAPDRALSDLATKKMTVQKTARGPISFDSVDLELDAVILVNEKYSGSEQPFQKWIIRRQIDQQPEIVYDFPATFSLRPRQTIRILSKRSPPSARSIGDILMTDKIDTWGIGQKMVTRLIDNNNEEKAIITQIFQ